MEVMMESHFMRVMPGEAKWHPVLISNGKESRIKLAQNQDRRTSRGNQAITTKTIKSDILKPPLVHELNQNQTNGFKMPTSMAYSTPKPI